MLREEDRITGELLEDSSTVFAGLVDGEMVLTERNVQEVDLTRLL